MYGGSLHLFSDFMHSLLQAGSKFLKIMEEFRNHFDTKEDVYDEKDKENLSPTDILHIKKPV